MNIVVYARYSSHAQNEQSIEGQLQACYDYAKANGHIIIDEYIDRAQSGKTDSRTEFQRMISDSDKQAFEAVLVYQLDRFARNRYDSAINKAKLKKNGVRVLSAKENISEDASGILVEGVLESMAEYYSAELSEKTRRGMNINAQKCLSNGSLTPLGFSVDSERRFHIDPAGASIVKEVYESYAAGKTVAEIICSLNERNLKTAQGKSFNKNSLHRILRSKKYTGVYTYGNIETPGGMPRIISDELFEQVQLILDRNKKAAARTRGAGEYLLTTKLFCGHCKEMMVGYGGTGKSGKVYYYYTCKNKTKHLCDKKLVDKKFIEDRVISECWNLLSDERINEIANAVMAACEKDYNSSALKSLRRDLKAAENAIENLWRALEQGEELEGLRERIDKRTTEKKDIEARITIEENRDTFFTKDQVSFFLHKLKSGDINDDTCRKGLVNIFINAVYLYDDKLTLILNSGNVKTEISDILLEEIEADIADAGCSHKGRLVTRRGIEPLIPA